MDIEELHKEIKQKRESQNNYEKRLKACELQHAKLDVYAPSHLVVEMADLRESIEECKQQIENIKKEMRKTIQTELDDAKRDLRNQTQALVTLGDRIQELVNTMKSIANEANETTHHYQDKLPSVHQYNILVNDLPGREIYTFTKETISLTRISGIVAKAEACYRKMHELYAKLKEVDEL